MSVEVAIGYREVALNCPFCAKPVSETFLSCPFCGAVKQGDQWFPAARPLTKAPRRKGGFTIVSAGVLFILSGLFTLVYVTSEVPLFGALRSGATAACYNLVFAVLFLGIGAGLIAGKAWGYRLVLGGTVLYSIDKILFMLDRRAREAYLDSFGITHKLASVLDAPEPDIARLIEQVIFVVCATSIACWWGFAVYIYVRRSCFQQNASPKSL